MRSGLPDGLGTYRDTRSGTLVGDFQAGQLADGHVLLSDESGFRYDGDWKDGCPDGQGTMRSSNGTQYGGEWHNGKKEGQGTFNWPSGNRYVSEWLADKQTGHGVLTFLMEHGLRKISSTAGYLAKVSRPIRLRHGMRAVSKTGSAEAAAYQCFQVASDSTPYGKQSAEWTRHAHRSQW